VIAALIRIGEGIEAAVEESTGRVEAMGVG
jgi:hypothetical protein